MNETVIEILKKAMKLAEQTGEFVIEQGGDILIEFYMWHTAKNTFFILFGVIMYLTLVYIIRGFLAKTEEIAKEVGFTKYVKSGSKYYKHKEGSNSITAYEQYRLFRFFAIVIGLAISLTHIYNLIFLIVAPKLYLLGYIINAT